MHYDKSFNNIFEHGITAPRWYLLADGTVGLEYTAIGKLTLTGANLGIGATPSAWPSSYRSVEIGRAGNGLAANTTNGQGLWTSNTYWDGSNWKYANNGIAAYVQLSEGTFTVANAPSGTAGNNVTFTVRATLDVNGFLGLNSSPSAWSTGRTLAALHLGSQNAISGGSGYSEWSQNNYYDGSNWKYISTAVATLHQQTGGVHAIYGAASGTAGSNITWTALLSIEKDKSVALQGASRQTGTGITFPAALNASSDVNTLDDYEETTFTPAVTFGGGSTGVTYSARSGRARKVGQIVYAEGYMALTSKGSSTGVIGVSGFPYTSASGERGAGPIWYQNNIAAGSGYGWMLAMDPSSTAATVFQDPVASTYTGNPTNGQVTNTWAMYFSITYTAAS